MADLITGVLGTVPDDEVVESLHRRSDGNPFFAEELLASGLASGGHGLSPTLRDVLATRMAGVSEDARMVLGIAAVGGRALSHGLMVCVAQDRVADPEHALRDVIEAGLLIAASSDGDDGYAFRHALVQEAAYTDLLAGERRTLHRAFAEALETEDRTGSGGAGCWVELAHHWRSARDLRHGLDASVRAGNESSDAYAFAQALVEYEHALAISDQLAHATGPIPIDRIDLLRRTARAAYLVSEDRRAIVWLREAIDLCRAEADAVRTGVLLEQLGRVLCVSGDAVSAVTVSEAAIAAIPIDPPSAERARAISGLAQVLMLNGRYGRSRDLCREAVAIARAAGAREPEGHALNTLGLDLAHLGEIEPAIESLELALAIGWEVRNADDVGRAFVNLADTLWMTGDPAGALRRVEEGILAADELGVRSVYGYYLRLNGMFYAWELGEWSTAERFYREAMARPPDGGGGERYRLAYALHWLVASGAAEAEASWAKAWDLVCHDPSATTTTVLLLLVLRMAARTEADLAIAAGTREARAQARATIGDLVDEAASIRGVLGAPEGRTGERISLESATIAAEASRLADAPSADVWSALRDRWHAWGNPTRQRTPVGGWRLHRPPRVLRTRRRVPCSERTRSPSIWAPHPCWRGWRASPVSCGSCCAALRLRAPTPRTTRS